MTVRFTGCDCHARWGRFRWNVGEITRTHAKSVDKKLVLATMCDHIALPEDNTESFDPHFIGITSVSPETIPTPKETGDVVILTQLQSEVLPDKPLSSPKHQYFAEESTFGDKDIMIPPEKKCPNWLRNVMKNVKS